MADCLRNPLPCMRLAWYRIPPLNAPFHLRRRRLPVQIDVPRVGNPGTGAEDIHTGTPCFLTSCAIPKERSSRSSGCRHTISMGTS